VEDWLGEGELPYTMISNWSDTQITFKVPEGLGLKQIYVSVRGSPLVVEPKLTLLPNTPVYRNSSFRHFFAYNAPIISSVTPSSGIDTDGNTLVTIEGSNFGPPLYNLSTPGATRNPLSFFPDIPLYLSASLPSSYTAIVFYKSCVTYNRDMRNFLVGASIFQTWFGSTDLRSCQNVLLSRTHNKLVFLAPKGIGKDRNVQVITVDASSDVTLAGSPNMASDLAKASYSPPLFLPDGGPTRTDNNLNAFSGSLGRSDDTFGTFSLPNIYGGGVLYINGFNFGDPSLAIAQQWSDADSQLTVKVNGVFCGVTCNYDTYPFACRNTTNFNGPPGPARLSKPGVVYNIIQCGLDPSTPAGFADVEISVAQNPGQYRKNTTISWLPGFASPPLIVCKGSTSSSDFGFYGKMNEICLPCPIPSGWEKPGAKCIGFDESSNPFNPKVAPTPLVTEKGGCSLIDKCGIRNPGESSSDCIPFYKVLNMRVSEGDCKEACINNKLCLGFTHWDSPEDYTLQNSSWTGRCYLTMNASLPFKYRSGTFEIDVYKTASSNCTYKRPFFAGVFSPYPTLNAGSVALFPGVWSMINDLLTYPIPLVSYYNLNGSMASACPAGMGIPGRDVCIVPCQPSFACAGANFCSVGYRSVPPMYRCSSCDIGYFRAGINCIKCPDSPYTTLALVILLLIFLAGLGFWLNKHQVNIAVLSIGVDYFQVLAILTNASVPWPPILQQLWRFMSAFNLNIEIVAPECLVPDVAFQTKWLIIMAIPLGLMALLTTQFLYLWAFKRWVKGHTNKRKLCSHYPTLISSWLVLMYLFYLYMTKTVLDIFNCIPTSPPDGNLYLSVTFEKCTNPVSGSQAALFAPALVGLCVYSFAYPFYVASNLYRKRELVMEDQLLRAKGTGNDPLSNPNAFMVRRTFGRTYYQFKPQWYLWVQAILLRKLCIAATSVIFSVDPSFQMAACLLIMFLAFSAQVQVRPYLCSQDYDEVLKFNSEMALNHPKSVYAKLQGRLASVSMMQRKKSKANPILVKGKINAFAALDALGLWLMNYNTIEAIMLFSGVLVSLLFLLYIVRTTII